MKTSLKIAGADLLRAGIALFLSFLVRNGKFPAQDDLGHGAGQAAVLIATQIFCMVLMGLHEERKLTRQEVALRISCAQAAAFILLISFSFMFSFRFFGPAFQGVFLFCAGFLQFLNRVDLRLTAYPFAKKILILGTGPLASQIGTVIAATKNYVLSGYVNCDSEQVYVPSHAIVGREEWLMETVKREKAQKIVVSLSERRGVFPLQNVLNCKLSGIDVIDASSFYEQVTRKIFLENITPSWLIFSHGFRITMLMRRVKRFMDITCALTGMLLVLPLLPFIALAIKLDSSGPLFFSQVRVGEGEKTFAVYKFRTMVMDAEGETGAVWAQEKDPRVTRAGKFFRTTRIDEIPQLFNVLKGDMSFVGPRPERPEFVAKLKEQIPFYAERHVFKPGVTGWAQIRYPYGASVADSMEKLRYDLYYIKNYSLALDIRIIIETVKVVLSRKGGR